MWVGKEKREKKKGSTIPEKMNVAEDGLQTQPTGWGGDEKLGPEDETKTARFFPRKVLLRKA